MIDLTKYKHTNKGLEIPITEEAWQCLNEYKDNFI
jgi:hypothetical protein